MAAVTMFVRFLPFLCFPEGRKRPKVVTYLGTVLPYAVIGMLVVYCFKDVSFFKYPYHIWRRNTLLSVFAGVAFYMVLVQLVF